MAPNTSLYGAHIFQGICRARAGFFPATYVREFHPPNAPHLETPFDTGKAKESSKKAGVETGWGATEGQERKSGQIVKKAYVSSEDDEDGEILTDKPAARPVLLW
jgi:ABC-type transport system substrate-binding protein